MSSSPSKSGSRHRALRQPGERVLLEGVLACWGEGGSWGGKRRGRGPGSAAVPPFSSSLDQNRGCFAVGVTEPSGTWQPRDGARSRLARPRGCLQGVAGSRQSKKRRGDPKGGFAWSTCPAALFPEVSPCPTTSPAFPSPLAGAQATTAGGCPGSCAAVCPGEGMCSAPGSPGDAAGFANSAL